MGQTGVGQQYYVPEGVANESGGLARGKRDEDREWKSDFREDCWKRDGDEEWGTVVEEAEQRGKKQRREEGERT